MRYFNNYRIGGIDSDVTRHPWKQREGGAQMERGVRSCAKGCRLGGVGLYWRINSVIQNSQC